MTLHGSYQELAIYFTHLNLIILAITYELSFNCGQLLFEAGKVLVECPHKSLVGPEGRLGALLVTVGGTGARWAGFRAVPRHLVYELLEPEHRLPIHGNVLQYRVQTVLQHQRRKGLYNEQKGQFMK